LGFSPTSILDVGAYEGQFSRGARQIWKDAYIFMIDALLEKEPMLASACRELGNADHLIAMLGQREMEAASFFVVDTEIATGSGKNRFLEISGEYRISNERAGAPATQARQRRHRLRPIISTT
jgi:hypothetical protein